MLTIITVTKDDYEGLVKTVKSTEVLRATTAVTQIIIDSSALEVRNDVENFVEQQKNVGYVWQPPSGIASAFNLGIRLANSEWVWFLNGGDIIYPELELQMFLSIVNQSTAAAIVFELEFMQSHNSYKHPPMRNLWPPVFNWIPHPATILRRNLFQQFGYFDENYSIAMDGELWFRFFSQNIIVDMLSIPIVLYDEQGLSSVKPKEMAVEVSKILKLNLLKLIRIWLGNVKNILDAIWHFNKVKHGR